MTGVVLFVLFGALGFAAGRLSMMRQIDEHDRTFNSNIRRLAFRFARAAHPKKRST